MFKKIALAMAVVASSSFATYTYFPVGNAGTGQVEIGYAHSWEEHDASSNTLFVKGEYVVMPNLELSLLGLGYVFMDDGIDGTDDTDGFTAMTIGARYQFMPFLIGALDVELPLSSDDFGDYDPFGLFVAVQYTQEFIPNLVLGSEAGVEYKFEDDDTDEGLLLKVQAELDYTIASLGLTPWVGLEFDYRLTDTEFASHSADDSGDNSISFWVGGSYAINQMFAVKANFILTRGDFGDSETVNAALDINF